MHNGLIGCAFRHCAEERQSNLNRAKHRHNNIVKFSCGRSPPFGSKVAAAVAGCSSPTLGPSPEGRDNYASRYEG